MRPALALLLVTAACGGDIPLAAAPDAAGADTDAGAVDTGPVQDAGPADSGPTDSGPGDAGPADAGPLDAGPADSGPPPPDCTGKDAVALDSTWSLSHNLVPRSFDVHLPPTYDGTRALPVVLSFHGLGSNAAQQTALTRIEDKADEENFVAVHPHGLLGSWNAGIICCGAADDVGFVAAILDDLQSRLCIDAARVYAIGFSNGGMFTHRLACDLSHRIAAIAPVSGVNVTASCNPSRPVPVMHTHGSADTTVPYNGGYGGAMPSAVLSTERWAVRDGCASAPTEVFRNGNAHCDEWLGCASSRVVFCTVDGMAHMWPGGFGETYANMNATEMIWDFLEPFRLP